MARALSCQEEGETLDSRQLPCGEPGSVSCARLRCCLEGQPAIARSTRVQRPHPWESVICPLAHTVFSVSDGPGFTHVLVDTHG